MRRFLLLTCLVGLLTVAAFPQGARYDNIVLSSTGQPLAGVTITTYSDSACTVALKTYTNVGLTLPVGGQSTVSTTSLGNWGFWLAPSTFYYTVTSRFVTDTSCHPVTLNDPPIDKGFYNVATDCPGVVYDGVFADDAAINACYAAHLGAQMFWPHARTSQSACDAMIGTAITSAGHQTRGAGGNISNVFGTKVCASSGSGGFILTGLGSSISDMRIVGSDPAPSSSAQSQAVNLLIPANASLPEYTKTISTISRTADVVTVRFTNVPHWYPAKGIVTISGVSEDTSFNGTYYVVTSTQASTGGASSFTYTQTGAPDVVQFSPAAGRVGLATTYTAHGDGISLRQSFQRVQNVSVEDFGRYGIFIDGNTYVADDWRIDDSNVTRNRAHGLRCFGTDCNAGTSLHLGTYYNGLWGIFDTGFLGNTHIAPQASYNFGGAVKPVAGAFKTISSISRTSSVLSVTTSTAHGFSVGHGVFFDTTSGALYDTTAGTVGCFVATVPTTTSFTCLQPGYALSDQGATAAGRVRLGSWAEVTTGAAVDGGPFTVGRTNAAGHWLMSRPYDESGQGANKYNCCVIVEQPHSGGGIDANWNPGLKLETTSTGTFIDTPAGFINRTFTDVAAFWSFQAGVAADQTEHLRFNNHSGTVQWAIRAETAATSLTQWGLYNGDSNTQTNPCFVVFRGSGTIRTDINAGCAEASSGAAQVRINAGTNSGTGGIEVHSGGASPALVASISGTGVGKFSGLTSFTAGGFDVGSAALPFANVYIGGAATNNIKLTGTAATAKTATFPDNTGTVAELNLAQSFTAAQTFTQQVISSLVTGTAPLSITSTTPVANLTAVPTTYNSAGTQQTGVHLVYGKCTLGTDCSITLSGAAIFTGTDSYECTATDQTAAAAVRVNQTSGSAVAFTGTGTDVIRYQCIGN